MGIHLNGVSNNKVNLGNPSSLQITGAFTAMSCVKLDITQNTEHITKQLSSARGFSLQNDDDGTDSWLLFVIAKTASTTMSSGWPSTKISDGVWHHAAGVFIPSTAVQCWQDGVLGNEKTTGVPATMYDPLNDVTIGARPDGSQPFDGLIDDVRLYNRALAAAEMMAIAKGRGRDGIVGGLVFRSLMNEKSPGTTMSGAGSIKDLSIYGNHGTPSGTSVYAESSLTYRR